MTRLETDGRSLEWSDIAIESMGYEEAMRYADGLGEGWRLPTVHELCGLWSYENGDCPAFPWQEGWFWTSDRYVGPDVNPEAPTAWAVLFRDGSLDDVGLTFPASVRVCRTVA